jgi:NAD(P)H-dependent FMN reductase
MRLAIFNGSPRGEGSNTKILMQQFTNGFTENNDNNFEIAYLNKIRETDRLVEFFKQADQAILAFPLYTDAMPGIVKHFIEALEPLCGRKENPGLGFVIQSGFPEPIHSRYVARYMEKLTKRLGCPHTGTVIRGGVEGIQVQPPWMTKKLLRSFYRLGSDYAASGRFNGKIIRKLAPRQQLSAGRRLFFRFLGIIGVANMYWNMKLKENRSFEKRFAQPYKDF